MKIYALTIIKETTDEHSSVATKLYAKPEDAIKAYNNAIDEAQEEAKNYTDVHEANEIATDTPYRWWSIYDLDGSYCSITIELDTKEVL